MKELIKKKPVEVNDKKFNTLLKQYSPKTMEVFELNEVFKYTPEQKKKLKELLK